MGNKAQAELKEERIRGKQFGRKSSNKEKSRKERKPGSGDAQKKVGKKERGKQSKHGRDANDPDQQILGANFWDSIPILPVEIELRTKYSQHLFRRVRRQFAVNCYIAEMVPAIELWNKWQQITDAVNTLMDHAFQKVDMLFRESEEQSEHMIKVLGITEMPHYMNVQHTTYATTTPRVKQFLQYLRRLDDQVIRLDALWMAEGGIEHKRAMTESIRLRSVLGKVTSHIYRQSDRVRRVLRGNLTYYDMLLQVQDDLDRYFGVGLKTKDSAGKSMLLPGEDELEGALVGETASQDAVEEKQGSPDQIESNEVPDEQVSVGDPDTETTERVAAS